MRDIYLSHLTSVATSTPQFQAYKSSPPLQTCRRCKCARSHAHILILIWKSKTHLHCAVGLSHNSCKKSSSTFCIQGPTMNTITVCPVTTSVWALSTVSSQPCKCPQIQRSGTTVSLTPPPHPAAPGITAMVHSHASTHRDRRV